VEVIDKVNVTLSTYLPEDMGEVLMNPESGNVAFGAGKDCWAFTVSNFARFYSTKF
jgi:elongation factor 2